VECLINDGLVECLVKVFNQQISVTAELIELPN